MDTSRSDPVETSPVCYRHPDRVTGLSCSECGKPLCHECSYDAAVGQKCAECAKPVGRNRVITARQMRQSTPVVTGILALTIVAFLVQLQNPGFEADFLQSNRQIANGEWWRIFTAAFLHGGYMHIGFNMYALWLFGPSLERQLGSAPFAALYMAAAAAGGAAYYLLGSPFGRAVGASGAIFGLFGAWLVGSYRSRNTPAGAAQFRSLLLLLGINLALPFLIPLIAWQAHLGGLIAGAAIMAIWLRLPRGPGVEWARTGTAAAVFILAIVLTWLA